MTELHILNYKRTHSLLGGHIFSKMLLSGPLEDWMQEPYSEAAGINRLR